MVQLFLIRTAKIVAKATPRDKAPLLYICGAIDCVVNFELVEFYALCIVCLFGKGEL